MTEHSAGPNSIGCCVAENFIAVYKEVEALLGIPFRWNDTSCRVLIVDSVDISGFTGDKVILACGPTYGSNPNLRQVRLPFDLGSEASRLLMLGQSPEEAAQPKLDQMLAEIRSILGRELPFLIQLPPIPWKYNYIVTLTHDIDILSLKEMPLGRTLLGYFYRCTVVNWRRFRQGKVTGYEFFQALGGTILTCLAKLGIGRDCWEQALQQLLELEKRLEVRSSLYFMPFPRRSGRGTDGPAAPNNRASYYDIAKKASLLQTLEEQGWEAGVHGIDAWHNASDAAVEFERVNQLTGRADIGIRMHWLYFNSPQSFQALDRGGFLYDSTFGYNEVPGFRAGTLQPYRPPNAQRLWELPLHIQDGALLAEEHGDLNRTEAYNCAEKILDWAGKYGGAVSLLWHNQSFTAPRFWGEVYEQLISRARRDNAWIATPRNVISWFQARRQCEISLKVEGSKWIIYSGKYQLPDGFPKLCLRVYINPERVKSASVPYRTGEGFIDLPVEEVIYLEIEGER